MTSSDLQTKPFRVHVAEQWVRDLNSDRESYFVSAGEQLECAEKYDYSAGVLLSSEHSDFIVGILASADLNMFVQYSVIKGWHVV